MMDNVSHDTRRPSQDLRLAPELDDLDRRLLALLRENSRATNQALSEALGVAPSTCAACSSSHGICWKNAVSVQMEIGSVRDRYGMIRPGHVSYRPSVRHMLNSGVTREITGNMETIRETVSTTFLPGKSKRAIA